MFSRNDLEKKSRFNLKGKVESLDTNESFDVLVTNIDTNSCFALVDSPEACELIKKLNPKAQYRLTAEYEGIRFSHLAELTSTYDQGIGLNLLSEQHPVTQLNWSDLYKVCLERGLFNS